MAIYAYILLYMAIDCHIHTKTCIWDVWTYILGVWICGSLDLYFGCPDLWVSGLVFWVSGPKIEHRLQNLMVDSQLNIEVTYDPGASRVTPLPGPGPRWARVPDILVVSDGMF